jgi:hypothetical protein
MPNGTLVLEVQEIQYPAMLRSIPEKFKTWDE